MKWRNVKESTIAFAELFFPRQCVVCTRRLLSDEKVFCLSCRYQLPLTRSWEKSFNPAIQKFMGRIPLKEAHAMMYFTHQGITQKLIHQIKYQGRKDLAFELGYMFGGYLSSCPGLSPDYLVPVPLHIKKERQRGYNQSEEICRGIAACMRIPVLKKELVKVKNTDTQTHLTTIERIENVRSAFTAQQQSRIENKHLLLVDDVLTTGATLEACASALLASPNVTVSIATLAVAID